MSQAKSPDHQAAVKQCAALARLEISPQESEQLAEDFKRILAAFRGLSELDVSDVAPMQGAVGLRNVMREDRRAESLPREELLASAPKQEQGFFSVPKTLESNS